MLRELFQAQEEGQKAFPYRVELTDAGGPLLSGSAPAAYNAYNGFNGGGRIRTPLSQREAAIHMQTYGGTEAVDWLMDCLAYVTSAAASAGLHFDDKGKKLVSLPDPNDPSATTAPPMLTKLLHEPNPFMNWEDLVEITLIDWFLVGNAYWVKWQMGSNSQPLALYRMAPQYVKIVPGKFGPEKYRYRLPGEREDVEFTPDQIVHFKRTNPLDPYYGMGIVKGGARALDMEIGLTKTMASYYEKRALPSGVVQTERRVPKDVFNRLKQQLRVFYGGGNNAGQLMVLESGLKYDAISPNAMEAAFREMGGWSRDRIFAMFNMNKGLLGIFDGQGDPKLGDWQLLFDQKTMVPLMKKLARVISRGLTQPGWGLDLKIDYNEVQQPDQVLNRADTLAKLPGVKVHELRAAAGLPRSTGDKQIDDFVLNMPGPNMDANGKGGTADQNLPGERGRPPLPANTLGFTKRAPAAKAGGNSGVQPKPGKKSLEEILDDIDTQLAVKALAPATHVHVGKLGPPVVPPEDTLHPKRTSEVDILIGDVEKQLADAARTLERGLLDATDGKASGTVYQRVKNSKAWVAFRDKIATILEDAAQTALSLANVHHAGQGLDQAELDYEAMARGVVYRKSGGLPGILDTLKKRVLSRVLAGQQKGEPQSDIQKYIQEAISEWQTGNATAVAVDTTTQSYNEATLEIAEANGSTHVMVSDGTDHDEPCVAANGSTWEIGEARKNMQEHPRCRRAFVPIAAVG